MCLLINISDWSFEHLIANLSGLRQEHAQYKRLPGTSNGMRGSGAPMMYLSNTASFHPIERIVLSNRGIEQIMTAFATASPSILRKRTPRAPQRFHRLYGVLCEPYARGASQQRGPLRLTKMLPLNQSDCAASIHAGYRSVIGTTRLRGQSALAAIRDLIDANLALV
jgi:hypothetical protein